ncbi:MAG: M20/M25/M40 family metallo-hydrolase [Planctomycetia bacterium]|nr:M20/M25/M40 family metallo-hydrolase [Planctomycetia bacterium]
MKRVSERIVWAGWLVFLLAAAVWGEEKPHFDTISLRKTVEHLAGESFAGREFGTTGGASAAKFLVRELKRRGCPHAFTQEIPEGTYPIPGTGHNVIGFFPGKSQKTILLSAHYDHLGSREWSAEGEKRRVYFPGADDNASSVAILLHVVEKVARKDEKLPCSVLFLFFDGEEKGLLGSQYWQKNPTHPLELILFALNGDMAGHLEPERGLYVFGTRSGSSLRAIVTANASENLKILSPWSSLPRSDHAVFLQAGIPAMLFVTGIHPTYHTPEDSAEKLNYVGMAAIADWIFGLLTEVESTTSIHFQAHWHDSPPHGIDPYLGFFEREKRKSKLSS